MIKVRRAIGRSVLVLGLIGATAVVAPQSASAHHVSWTGTRSGCTWTGGLSTLHNYAWTIRSTGSCSGHGWLRVQYSDGKYEEFHGDPGASVSTGNYGIVKTWHKTQSSDSWSPGHS